MFKISKLENVKNEKVNINLVTYEQYEFKNGKKSDLNKINTLSFDILGDDYSFEFELNCKLDKLLEIPMSKTLDFKDYIFNGETYLSVVDTSFEPELDIKITRYLKNNFIILLTFYTCGNCDNYSGIIEFTFNLDDYLNIDENNKN